MSARPDRFIATDFNPILASDLNLEQSISNSLQDFGQLLETELQNAPKFSKAWSKAKGLYESVFENLNAKDSKYVKDELAELLPEGLKENPDYLVVAVIAFTMEDQDFNLRFTEVSRKLLSGEKKWPNFRFKSFFILLTYAIKLLPSRPNRNLNKTVFRGVQEAQSSTLKVGDIFSLGQFSSFSPKRRLALGKMPKLKPSENKEEEEAKEDDDDEQEGIDGESDGDAKTILRTKFGPGSLNGLGVRHISPSGSSEVEVIVHPMQTFRVTAVNDKKAFKVIVVEPVNS